MKNLDMGSLCKRHRKLQGSWYMDLSYKAQDNAEVVVFFFFFFFLSKEEESMTPRAWDLLEPLLQQR